MNACHSIMDLRIISSKEVNEQLLLNHNAHKTYCTRAKSHLQITCGWRRHIKYGILMIIYASVRIHFTLLTFEAFCTAAKFYSNPSRLKVVVAPIGDCIRWIIRVLTARKHLFQFNYYYDKGFERQTLIRWRVLFSEREEQVYVPLGPRVRWLQHRNMPNLLFWRHANQSLLLTQHGRTVSTVIVASYTEI